MAWSGVLAQLRRTNGALACYDEVVKFALIRTPLMNAREAATKKET